MSERIDAAPDPRPWSDGGLLAQLDELCQSAGMGLQPNRLPLVGRISERHLVYLLWWLRRVLAEDGRSDVASLRVEASREEVVTALGQRHFEPAWEVSYYYRGEVLNYRRVRLAEGDPYNWGQVHVRGFETDDGLELDAHWEPEPLEHPERHRSGEFIEVDPGIEAVADVLDAAGVDYERLDPGGTPA